MSMCAPVLPAAPRRAAATLLEFLIDSLWPLTVQLKSDLSSLHKNSPDEKHLVRLREVFSVCCSQVQKCVLHLLEIFKIEHQNAILLQESRDCTIERISWCLNRLLLVQKTLDQIPQTANESKQTAGLNIKETDKGHTETLNRSILVIPMYFVNWIDHILELLTNLSSVVYRTDCNESTELYDTWKNEVMDSVSGLHISVDELLLSAMTLCRYCLPADQTVITARCQVVLRETKKLISEIIKGNMDAAYTVTKDSLKLPLKPTNINVFIDVLKDAIYVLESNTNTGLLSLLVHCFSNTLAPLQDLEAHFSKGSKGLCPCEGIDDVENCLVVKEFDFYNERLIQMSGFSISCSSDENRMLCLKSGLASLEALDPHLVPTVMMSAGSHHAKFLTNAWRREVLDIRDNIYLIVDPAALSERAKDTMNKKLLELIKDNKYNNSNVCSIINVGETVSDFFATYTAHEPEALVRQDKLEPLLKDLFKAIKECKTVSNLLSTSRDDFLYDIPKVPQATKPLTVEQLLKRLKLLYTILNRIDSLFRSEEDNYEDDCDGTKLNPNNATHTLHKERPYIIHNTPRDNVTRNTFVREYSKKDFGPPCVISKITQHMNRKKIQEFSFSVQLDELFNDISQFNDPNKTGVIEKSNLINRNISKTQNTSILYDFPAGLNRQSLRKVVLKKNYVNPKDESLVRIQVLPEVNSVDNELDVSRSMMDSTTNLQITDILDQLSNFSKIINTEKSVTKTVININGDSTFILESPHINNILTLPVNDHKQSENVWSIPINASIEDSVDSMRPSEFSASSSNVTTLERLNDLDLLEDRLSKLKSSNA